MQKFQLCDTTQFSGKVKYNLATVCQGVQVSYEFRMQSAIAVSCCTSQDWIFTVAFLFFSRNNSGQIFAYNRGLSGPDKIKFQFYLQTPPFAVTRRTLK